MKKFTLLVAALAISLVTFAQGTITYNLNGGVTNDYGWQDKQDMYETLNADWNAFKGTTTTWTPLADLTDVAKGIPTEAAAMDLTFLEDANFKLHFSWLVTYMDAECTTQGQTLTSSHPAYLRYGLSAFFMNSQRASYPVTPDYALAGNIEYFQPTWKAGFCGPAEYAEGETVVLPAPYKEGESFLGWFKEADFSGEKVTEISGTGDVVLYAKFGEYIPTIAEVIAMADATATKVQGTVSFVAGNNFWIQDASGAILCFGENHGLVEGELATLAGEKVVSNGSPMLNNATVVAHEAGKEVGAQTLLISVILADSVKAYATYLNEVVYIEGDETECKHWNHDCNYRKCHEVASCLEEAVSRTVGSLECVNHRKKIDRHVKKKEDDQEKAAYTHYKLLGN